MVSIDIGSNEGIDLDMDIGIDIKADGYDYGRVDIIADGNVLPIRTDGIDRVHSGACLGSYVGVKGLVEMLRILRGNGAYQLRVLLPSVPLTLKTLIGKTTLTKIQYLNMGEDITDVMIEGINTESPEWTKVGETFDTPESWLNL